MLRRMLDSNVLPHTLLLHGPRGVGKAKCALSLAEALLGRSPKLMTGNHPDLHQLYPEGKAYCHPIENVRALIKEAALPPFEAPAKVFIIHDAHQMLPAGQNALLKTLEEPTAHTYFILITSQIESLLPTIVSRARPIPFFPLSDKDIEQYAREQLSKDPKEAHRIAFLSHGSLAKASQLALSSQDKIRTLVHALLALVLPQDYARLLELCEEVETALAPTEEEEEGKNASSQIEELLEEIFTWHRDVHLLKNSIAPEYIYHLDAMEQLQKKAALPSPSLEEVLKALLLLRASLQRHVKLRVALEQFFCYF